MSAQQPPETGPRGPVVIDLPEPETASQPERPSPANAPPVPDDAPSRQGAGIQHLAHLAARPPSPLRRWVFGLGGAVLTASLGFLAWSGVEALLARSAVLGGAFSVLLAGFVMVCVLVALKELMALSRLSSLEKIRQTAEQVVTCQDLNAARKLAKRLSGFYAGRRDLSWADADLKRALEECFDADAVLEHSERLLMTPLDEAARREVEAAARQVATVTALVPLALADLMVALTANLRMIRRIAEIYGGRAGTLGAWRLTRSVLTHLVATGALAVGDDLIGSIAGGGAVSKVSRRFGEGVVNGALTARVGVAAMEVCRPLPFAALGRPTVGGIVQRALTGVFQSHQTTALD